MMQAIRTKFVGPTDFHDARVSATCQAKRITVTWNQTQGVDENHVAAARELARRLGWDQPPYGKLVSGWLPDGSGCHVFVTKE